MIHNIKRLISLALVALIFSVPQNASGMDSFRDDMKEGWHDLKRQVGGFFNSADKKQADDPFALCPPELRVNILEQVAVVNYNVGQLRMVCKSWHSIIKNNRLRIKQSIDSTICDLPTDQRRFLNGRLIYKPDKYSDIGKIEFRIIDLENPLEGTFDLSRCGDAGQYLSISTGYRKGKKPENADKLEIWLAPRFLVEKDLKIEAKHLKSIMKSWNQEQAPVGLFWTMGEWNKLEVYDYLTTENMNNLSKINLYENWKKMKWKGKWVQHWSETASGQRYDHFKMHGDGVWKQQYFFFCF